MTELRAATISMAESRAAAEEFEQMSKDAAVAQFNTLGDILSISKNVVFLQKYGLEGRTDPESFRKCIPITDYADIAQDIQRIVNGDDSSIFCASPVLGFSISSGTSAGKLKLFPVYQNAVEKLKKWNAVGRFYRNKCFPLDADKANLAFVYTGEVQKTPSGHLAGPGTTLYFYSDEFKLRDRSKNPVTSPDEVIWQGYKVREAMYCHLLCALIRRHEVGWITAVMAFSISGALRMLESENCWTDLVEDIRLGELNQRVRDEIMREAVSKVLSPNPTLADELKGIFEKNSNWNGIVQRLWPHAKMIGTIMTGTMYPYVVSLRHYAGSVPLVSTDYGAAECYCMATNLNPTDPPEKVRYTFFPMTAFYEFIPLENGTHEEDGGTAEEDGCTHTVLLHELKLGKCYEVLLTTYSGLYRYRLGDIVRVDGFHNTLPQISYVCRKNVLLSIGIDKTDESMLQMAVENAASALEGTGMELIEFSSYANLESIPGHYVIFWELKDSDQIDDGVLQKCCYMLDSHFEKPYQLERILEAIGPLELCIVRKGAFNEILENAIGRGTSASQFKHNRCTRNPRHLEILKDHIVKSYFSTS